MKKETYYLLKCPVCEYKTVGNWKEKMHEEYDWHFFKKHYIKPIIKSEKR